MTPSLTGYAHIVKTPGVLAGEPRIDGHRIRVRDIVLARDRAGHSPEEIASEVYPQLTLSQVYSALAYFEDHRDEIEAAAEREARVIQEFHREQPELVTDLRPDAERE